MKGTVFATTGNAGRTWRGKYHDSRGQRRSITFGLESEGWTRKKAEKAMQEIVVDVRRGDRIEPSKQSVSAFVAEWFPAYAERRGLKRTTKKSYRQLLDKYVMPEFGSRRLSSIDAASIERWMGRQIRQGSSPRSVNARLQVLGLILSEAVRLDKIPANPADKVERVKERRQPVPVMSAVEFQAVSAAYDQFVDEATGTELYDLTTSRLQFRLTHELALRRAEALGLRWKNVTLGDEPAVTICETWTMAALDTPKSEAGRRRLRIDTDLARDLAKHKMASPYSGADEFVLSGRSGRPLDDHIHAKLYRRACKAAGVDPNRRVNHDGRHSAISAAAASPQTSAWQLQRFAGHSSIATTQRYVHQANESSEVAEAIAAAWRGEAAVSS